MTKRMQTNIYLDISNYPFRYQIQHQLLFPASPSVKPRESSQLDFLIPRLLVLDQDSIMELKHENAGFDLDSDSELG